MSILSAEKKNIHKKMLVKSHDFHKHMGESESLIVIYVNGLQLTHWFIVINIVVLVVERAHIFGMC